jgi:ferredoxin-NADP reductase
MNGSPGLDGKDPATKHVSVTAVTAGCPFDHAAGGGKGETKAGCPFDRAAGGGKGEKRYSVYKGRRISVVETSTEEKNKATESCPFFAGAASKNSGIMKGRRESVSGVFHFKEDDTIEYSYTKPNLEFPGKINESDLFTDSESSPDGFFTREHGMKIPDYEAAVEGLLGARGRIWYTMARRMAGLMMNNRLVQAIDEMEIIEGDAMGCPDGSLQFASSMLGSLTNGYRAACVRNNISYQPAPALQIPWKRISERMGRKDVYFGVEDAIYNARPLRGKDCVLENLEIQAPIYGTGAESVIMLLFSEANTHLCRMIEPILALCRGDWLAVHICKITQEVKNLSRMMQKAIPDKNAGIYSIDPVDFATAFANATTPLKDGIPAFSGAGVPVFACLDHVIGRKNWNSVMGNDLLFQMEWWPKNWRRFVEYLRQSRIFEKVPEDLQYLWILLKDEYCGERGWLGDHKYRAYQFVELAGALGRSSNKGSSSGEGALKMLEESRQERDPESSDDRGSYKSCRLKGRIKSISFVSEDRLTKLVTIESSKPIYICVGDHVSIVMQNNDDTIWSFSTLHGLSLEMGLSVPTGTLTKEWKERLDFDNLASNVYNVLMCARLIAKSEISDRLTAANLCQVLSPEEPRLYSYATVNPTQDPKDPSVTAFELLVTKTTAGGCSAFLFESVGVQFSFGISTSSKFHIPKDQNRPVVVIAAGSGLGTYLPMLINDNIPNQKYAFLAFRAENTVPYLDIHLRKAVNYGKLNLFVELSREDTTLVSVERELLHTETKKRYIDELLLQEADLLRELAMPVEEGGLGATFYICGNSQFFKTVRRAMDRIDFGMISELRSSARFHLEVQARGDRGGQSNASPVTLAELCFHNKMTDYWTAIHGVVYDFTEYLPWHPGGRKILNYVAGTDCSEYFGIVNHDRDRMIYSQLAAYEVGPYDQTDSSGLDKYLELVTRLENCVNIYKEKEDTFDSFCDSYGKIQSLVESVFGREFLELAVHQAGTQMMGRVLSRIWLVKNGNSRDVAQKLYNIIPGSKERNFNVRYSNMRTGIFEAQGLRSVNPEERIHLRACLINACSRFFLRCKKAIVDVMTVVKDPSNQQESLYERMFFRLVTAFEEFYASLAAPFPLVSVRGWDVLKLEIFSRRTFLLRFKVGTGKSSIPGDFVTLASADPPGTEIEKEYYIDELLDHLEALGKVPVYRTDQLSIIDSWFEQEDFRVVFQRLDTDADGLVGRCDLSRFDPANEKEQKMRAVLESTIADNQKETCTFEEALAAIIGKGDPADQPCSLASQTIEDTMKQADNYGKF